MLNNVKENNVRVTSAFVKSADGYTSSTVNDADTLVTFYPDTGATVTRSSNKEANTHMPLDDGVHRYYAIVPAGSRCHVPESEQWPALKQVIYYLDVK